MDPRPDLNSANQKNDFPIYLRAVADVVEKANASLGNIYAMISQKHPLLNPNLPPAMQPPCLPLSTSWTELLGSLSIITTQLNTLKNLLSSRVSTTQASMQLSSVALIAPKTSLFAPLWTATRDLLPLIEDARDLLQQYMTSRAELPVYAPPRDQAHAAGAQGALGVSESPQSSMSETAPRAHETMEVLEARLNDFNSLVLELVQLSREEVKAETPVPLPEHLCVSEELDGGVEDVAQLFLCLREGDRLR